LAEPQPKPKYNHRGAEARSYTEEILGKNQEQKQNPKMRTLRKAGEHRNRESLLLREFFAV
jgi:hypothetical protein